MNNTLAATQDLQTPPARFGRGSHTLAALFLGLAGISAASAQSTYTVTDLGTLSGYPNCVPVRLNDQGHVVGYCAPAVENFNQMGFVWKPGTTPGTGTMTALGKLPKGNYSTAGAINSTGVIVGDGDTGNSRPQSWVKTPTGAMVNFFANNGGNTHALFIADDTATRKGYIGGYYTKSLSGNTSSWKGAIWTPNPKKPGSYTLKDLPILPGGTDPASLTSIPLAFNQAGQAAGYAMNNVIGQHAAFWNNDATNSVIDLGVYPDDWSSLAYGMNDSGQVVGESHPPFGSRAALWNNDAAHTASELPPLVGDNYGWASAINNNGQVIGGSYYGYPGTWDTLPSRLVVWKPSLLPDGITPELSATGQPVYGVVALQPQIKQPIAADGITEVTYTMTATSAINNNGQIVGTATTTDGVSHAVLLTPIP